MTDEAKRYFREKSYKSAQERFLKLSMPYEAGLCALLRKKPDDAKCLWQKAQDASRAAQWGLLVCEYICSKLHNAPTYFQLRAFFEVYLSLFIENELFDYAEGLIAARHFLFQVNPEVYKFIARTLFAYGYYNLLPEFIALSKECCFYDPEIHFIEAQMFLANDDFANSIKSLDTTLSIVPDYFPAQNLKNIILTKP